MSNPLIPVDLDQLIRADIDRQRRKPDGLLHSSSDLLGSVRHSQLRFVGAPQKAEPLVSGIRTTTGWFWHNHLHKLLVDAGVPVMSEVNLTPWMPEGWSGTADWIFYSPAHKAFVLGDLKTTKGESMKFKANGGMSDEHWWQLSTYYYACVNMGLKMVKGVAVMYLPMNAVMGEDVKPMIIEAEPVPKDVLNAQMVYVKEQVDAYGAVFHEEGGDYMNEYLAPTMPRTQKLFWASGKKNPQWDVTLVPHWLSMFCPYDDALCDCNQQGNTKIGHWYWYEGDGLEDNPDELIWVPRKGFEEEVPLVKPDDKEVKRRAKS